MSDDVLIIMSIVWGIPLLLFVFYYVGERICRIDIKIEPKTQKKRTKFWLRKRHLYRKARRFLWAYSIFRPTLVFLRYQEPQSSYRDYEFSREERLEQVGYSVRTHQWIKTTKNRDGYWVQIYGNLSLGLSGL